MATDIVSREVHHAMKGDDPIIDKTKPEKSLISTSYNLQIGDEDPTEDELVGPSALRRVSAPIPWAVYSVAFVELCERFSYYGTQVLCGSSLMVLLSSILTKLYRL